MINLTIKRPVGAAADAKELEYITALHQTCDEMDDDYVDGSIEAKDVRVYLISRYGIEVEMEDIQKMVFQDLAGGGEDTDCIDICELVAMLLIPFFAKLVKGDLGCSFVEDQSLIDRAFSNDSQVKAYVEDIEYMNSLFSKSSIVELVLKNMLLDSFGSTEPQPINSETVRTILTTSGEPRLLEDEQLIEDMVLDLSGGDPEAVLDVESLSRALSNDILLYDVKKEISLSTYLHDVFGAEEMRLKMPWEDTHDEQDANEDSNNDAPSQSEANPLTNGGSNLVDDLENEVVKKNAARMKNTFTCSQVDFLSDGCRSKAHLIMTYCLFIIFIFRFQNRGYEPNWICDNSSIGCSIAKKTMRWVMTMVVVIGVGVPFILLTTVGNSLRGRSIITAVIGCICVGSISSLFRFRFNLFVLKNDVEPFTSNLIQDIFYNVIMVCALIPLNYIQAYNLIKAIKPAIVYSTNKTVAFFSTRGTIRETFLLKLSASKKVHCMMKHAFDLHLGEENGVSGYDGIYGSTQARALLNYTKAIEKTETVGGIIWCWKSFLNRSLVHKEGVMVNSRLILCNVLQFVAMILVSFAIPTFMYRVISPQLYPPHEQIDCGASRFNPEYCFFPTTPFPMGIAVCHGIHFNDEDCFSDYFTVPISSSLDSRHNNSEADFICNEMVNFLDDVNATAWSLVYDGKDSQEFINASSQVVDTLLCQGMYLFNSTLWLTLHHSTNSTLVCNAPTTEILCLSEQLEIHSNNTFQATMDSLLLGYKNKYKQIIQPVVQCIESYVNDKVMDEVFSGATSQLQNTAIETTEASWSTLFFDPADITQTGFDINQEMKNWVGESISPEVANEIIANNSIFNHSEIVNHIPSPVLSSSPSIIQLETAAMSLVDSFFLYINVTLMDLYAADTSDLDELPLYVTLPHLGINSICQDIWGLNQNTSIILETTESTPENYCRAHVTYCTKTGICLLGLASASALNKAYLPFSFIGPLCSSYDNGLDKVMEMKDKLGLLESYVPDQRLFNVSLWIALAIAVCSVLLIFILFIPNTILVALKYRSGLLSSLRCERFRIYRRNITSITFLIPVVFWSAIGMAIGVFGVLFAVIVILTWSVTRPLTINLISLICGVGITWSMKKLFVELYGKYTYAAFYREKPALNNIVSVALECWHIFLSIAFVISRAVKLLVLTMFFIGRIDRNFLAEDIKSDYPPIVFRQAVLAADAHRHPYIERLGMMYMMKLKHGDEFGKRSSSTWRLLFVFVLMPWLQKYRIINDLEKEAIEKREIEIMRKTIKILNTKLMEKNDHKDNESDGCLSYDDSIHLEDKQKI